jgi:Ca-activated chloride channel family protein
MFEYPFAFLFLLLYFVCKKFCKQRNEQLIFPNMKIFKQVSQKQNYLVSVLEFLAVLLLTIALASPFKQDAVVIDKDKGYEISMILDASGSMKEYNKFGIVKDIVTEFVDMRKHDKLGLTIFADFSYVAIPLTYDKDSIKRLLSRLDVGIAGTQRTALYEALFMSSKLFKNSKAKEKIAILLTDGVNNVDNIPLDVAINTAKKYGIKVYVIGVGNRGDYNPMVLKRIAKETGGEFFEANSVEKLKKIYEVINKLEKSEIKVDKYIKKSHYFQYPLSAGLLLMLLYFFTRNRRL